MASEDAALGDDRARVVRVLATLGVRREFLAVANSGRKCAMPGLVLQARAWSSPPSSRPERGQADLRLGLTASRKVGNAVVRNRARRRLRALGKEILAVEAKSGHDYVLIARGATASRDYRALRADLRGALKRLRLYEGPEGPADNRRSDDAT